MTQILDDELAKHEPDRSKYEFYRDFFKAEHAASFAKMLKDNGIPYRLEGTQTLMTGTITGHGLVPFAVLKLRTSDFSKVNDLLEKEILDNPAVVKEHYFQDFDAAELLDVLKKPDEWTPEDVAVAKHLLRKNGVQIPEEKVQEFKQERLEMLQTGRDFSKNWLFAGYIAAIFGGLLIWPILILAAIGTGLYFWQDKTLAPDGQKFLTFNEKGRNAGQLLFFVALLCAAAGFLLVYVLGVETPDF